MSVAEDLCITLAKSSPAGGLELSDTFPDICSFLAVQDACSATDTGPMNIPLHIAKGFVREDGDMLDDKRTGMTTRRSRYYNVHDRVSHQKLVGFPTGFRASSLRSKCKMTWRAARPPGVSERPSPRLF